MREKHRSNPQIIDILNRIGARSADDLNNGDDFVEVTYELTSTDDSFTMKPVSSGSPVDPEELSARLSAVNGTTDETDYQQHPGQLDLDLPSLPEGWYS